MHLPDGFDKEAAFLESLSVAQNLGEITDTIRELSASEVAMREKLQRGAIELGKLLKTQNLRGRANQCIAHLAQARTSIVRLAQMFYPKHDPKEGWSQALTREFDHIFPEDNDRRNDFFAAIGYLRAVVDWRNALEHPKDHQYVTILDYESAAQGQLVAPTIEVAHANGNLERQDLIRFLLSSVSSLGNVFEMIISVCCDQKVRQYPIGITTNVAILPDDELVQGSRYMWQSLWNEGFPTVPPN